MNVPTESIAGKNRGRKRIWEISCNYHCSIIGTCLTLDEVSTILKKAGYPIRQKPSPYQLHGTAVALMKDRNRVSNMVQKTLDEKYSRDVRNYSPVSEPDSLMNAFLSSLKEGNVTGPYWAMMTHPGSTDETLMNAFGEIHMLSHLNGASRIGNIQNTYYLKTRTEILEEDKRKQRSRIRELEHDLSKLNQYRDMMAQANGEIERYRNEMESYKNGGTAARLHDELITLVNMYEMEKYRNEKAEARIKTLEKDAEECIKRTHALSEESDTLKREVWCMENDIALLVPDNEGENSCKQCEHCTCGKRHLEGKTVLYVGGRTQVISHCRIIVERRGGAFLYHDGGREENIPTLGKIIIKADVVFCPIDCVSHNACGEIKKLCRSYRKECRFLRSSGISSFSRALNELDGPAGHEAMMQ